MTWHSAADHIDAITEARERAAERDRQRRIDRLVAAATKLREERQAKLAEINRRGHCDECVDEKKTIANMGCLCSCHVGKLHAVADLEDEEAREWPTFNG